MPPVLVFHNVSKRYQSGDFWRPLKAQALRQVSFELRQGEVFGLIGVNGAGKTTLMKAAVGLLRPDEGEVRVFGQDPWQPAARRKFGYLPELPYFPKYLSALEILTYYGRLHSMHGPALAGRAEAALTTCGIWHAAREPLSRYSKGMQQRLGLAQTLLHDPDLVFLDEPMSGLDPLGIAQMREVIQNLKRQGKTVFFNSHVLADVERLCDRVGIMARGRLVLQQGVAELLASHASRLVLGLPGLDADQVNSLSSLSWPAKQEQELWTLSLPHQDLEKALAALRGLGITQSAVISHGSPLEAAFSQANAAAEKEASHD